MPNLTRRDTLVMGAGGVLAAGLPSLARADAPTLDLKPESGASLRVLRPTKFVAGDQQLFDVNTKRFTEQTGVAVTVDYESWEDLRPKTSVAANVGSGPDVVLGWLDDAFRFPDKLVDVTDVADYLGAKYDGWFEVPARYGRRRDGRWIGLPFGGSGACIVHRKSWLNEAGFDAVPKDFPGFLKAAQAMKAKGHPTGLALGNAVGDGNNWHWILWGFGGSVVDEDNRVVLDSPETVAALEYGRELYQTFPEGTLSWLDPSNNKAFLAGEVGMTPNGVSVYYVAKNSEDPRMRAVGEDTYHANLPVGPVGRPTECSTMVTAFAFKHTKYPNAAKAYLKFMFEEPQYGPWQTACIGYWAHTLKAYDRLPFWTEDPKVTPYRDITRNMLWFGYKGDPGPASSAFLADYVLVQMFANACTGAMTPQAAAKDAARRAARFYRS